MHIFIDITEPGHLYHHIALRARNVGIEVTRTILHKRTGLAGRAREKHPFYGLGADHLITDAEKVPVAAIERKSLEDLARTISIQEPGRPSGRIFRRLLDIGMHPMPILLLEGIPSPLYQRVEAPAAGIQFWCARQGISVMYTSGPPATGTAILSIAKKLGKELGFEPPPRKDDLDEISTPRSGTRDGTF